MLDSHDLYFQFQKATEAFPALTAQATPLGCGSFGLVVDHHDGTVSKICFSDEKLNEPEECMAREIAALRLLQGHRFDRVQTPALIGEPVMLDPEEQKNSGYLGHFRMTKLEGRSRSWYTLLKNGSPAAQARFFQQVGRLMAQFHEYSARHDPEHTPESLSYFTEHPDLREDSQAKLVEAQDYLAVHQKEGVIHGDLHSRNIMCNEQGDISALYDFSLFGRTANQWQEFNWVAAQCPSALADVIKGYEAECGQDVDRTALLLTGFRPKLSRLLQSLDSTPQEHREDMAAAVNNTIMLSLQRIYDRPAP
jgi:tRNA A-37 threonylcarbamoyl transferase component Bud32